MGTPTEAMIHVLAPRLMTGGYETRRVLETEDAWAREVAGAVVRQIEWISVSPGCTHSMLSPTN